MDVQDMTDTEIYKLGLEILLEKLGPMGRVRFLGQCEPANGNYTADRHKWLDNLDMEAIMQEVQELRKRKQEEAANNNPENNIHDMTDREVYRVGLSVISSKLGPSGLMQFLRLCKSTMSLYSTDDYNWGDKLDKKTVLAENQKEADTVKKRNK